jgi:hypothetical protein
MLTRGENDGKKMGEDQPSPVFSYTIDFLYPLSHWERGGYQIPLFKISLG